jgi:hypothetical protein
MGTRFHQLAFTPAVARMQERSGSRAMYAQSETADSRGDRLGPDEIGFIADRDSFYLATVSETGWPYLQHRGGPKGFLKVLDAHTIAFADFRGNLQYVSTGNLTANDRVALLLMDYSRGLRLKMLGHAQLVEAADRPALIASLRDPNYSAQVERAVLIRVEAFEWNCPQHITPRCTEQELAIVLEPLKARIRELEEQVRLASAV